EKAHAHHQVRGRLDPVEGLLAVEPAEDEQQEGRHEDAEDQHAPVAQQTDDLHAEVDEVHCPAPTVRARNASSRLRAVTSMSRACVVPSRTRRAASESEHPRSTVSPRNSTESTPVIPASRAGSAPGSVARMVRPLTTDLICAAVPSATTPPARMST